MTRTPWLILLLCMLLPSGGCTKKEEASYQGKPVRAWIAMLEDADPAQRFAAIRAIGEIGPEAREAIPALIETIRQTRNADKRTLAASVHALLGMGREIVPSMISLLKDDNWEMRRGAAWMLGKLGPDAKGAMPALTRALKDPNEVVRSYAAQALKRIKDEEGESKEAQPAPETSAAAAEE